MTLECAEYVRKCDSEMAAAHRARNLDQCVLHLDRARRYALLACRERQWQGKWTALKTDERITHY